MAIRNKVILAETSSDSPAIVSRGGRLFIAWKGSGNDNLNIMFSDDNGHSFRGKHISGETSDHQPALAVHNELLFIAWKGSGNENLNLARVATSGGGPGDVNFKIEGLVDKQIFDDTSDTGPSLASNGGALLISWKGSGNDNLSVSAISGFLL